MLDVCNMFIYCCVLLLQDIDIDNHYKNYSLHARKSLDAWSGLKVDLGLVCALCFCSKY